MDAQLLSIVQGVGGDSLVGNSVQLAERASVKRSTIGHHCCIGDKSKIINSILMDYVTVGEGLVYTHSSSQYLSSPPSSGACYRDA